MAVYPCDIGQHRYAGQQQSIYLTVVKSSRDPASVKLRLCPNHFVSAAKEIESKMDDVSDGGQMSVLCQTCGQPREVTVFARVYALKSEEQCFALDLCAACAEGWANDSLWSSGRPLEARSA